MSLIAHNLNLINLINPLNIRLSHLHYFQSFQHQEIIIQIDLLNSLILNHIFLFPFIKV